MQKFTIDVQCQNPHLPSNFCLIDASWYALLRMTIQAGLIFHNFFLCDFALMLLENVHHFLNLSNNFGFTAIWHRQSGATNIFHWWLAKKWSSLSHHQSHEWNDYVGDNNMAHIVSSSPASGFLTNMSEEHKSTSPSATQVKNWQTTEMKKN